MARSSVLALCFLFLVTVSGRPMKHDITNTTSSNDGQFLNPSPIFLVSLNSSILVDAVEGLNILITKFPALRLLNVSTWIECSNDVVPRVTALYLGAQNLSGYLPDFSSMDAIKRIDLHQNSLHGPIPEFLGTFPELTYLDLSNNHFTGALPHSLANNKKMKLKLAGNSVELPPPTVHFSQPLPSTKLIFPRLQFLFPPLPPTPSPQFLFPPNPPSPQFPSGGSDADINVDSPRPRPRTFRFPRILKFTLPPGIAAAVVGAVTAICCCQRRRSRQTANSNVGNT